MRKIILAALLLLVTTAATTSVAQASNHKATLTWTPSVDALQNPSIGANIYRADGACGSATNRAKVGSALAGVGTYVDTTVSAAKTYCYDVTATLNGKESGPSNTAGADIPLAPHTGLTVVPQ